jgi:hypothetical protein
MRIRWRGMLRKTNMHASVILAAFRYVAFARLGEN